MHRMASVLFFSCSVLSTMTPALGVDSRILTIPPNVRNLRYTLPQAAWTLNVGVNITHIPATFPKVVVYCAASSMVHGQYTIEAQGSAEQALDAGGNFVGKVPVYLATVSGMDATQATDWSCLASFVDAQGNVAGPYGPVFMPPLKSGGLFIKGPLPQ